MRISDWSSDVCSSDLACDLLFVNRQEAAALLEGEAAGDAPEALVAALRRAGVAEVVMTLGAAGICVANETETKIGRASCRARVCRSRRSRWARHHSKTTDRVTSTER